MATTAATRTALRILRSPGPFGEAAHDIASRPMRVGVLGTGGVGQTIATRLVELGHEVTMGSRSAGNEKAAEWVSGAGEGASEGSFADAAAHGEMVFNCTAGTASVDALRAAGEEELRGKVLVDVRKRARLLPGDAAHAHGLQRRLPGRADPARVPRHARGQGAQYGRRECDGRSDRRDQPLHLRRRRRRQAGGGRSAGRLRLARRLDRRPRRDRAARGTEMYLPLWRRPMGAPGTPPVNIAGVRQPLLIERLLPLPRALLSYRAAG